MEHKEIGPCIFLYENVIDNSQEIIELAESIGVWEVAPIGSNNDVDQSHRNTLRQDVHATHFNDIRWFEIERQIMQRAEHYTNEHKIFSRAMEPMQLLKYLPSEGFYNPHCDDGPGMPRIFSCVFYLNDVEEGGETHFNKFDISVKPKAGSMILFPANYAYLHEARPAKSGEKYVIVTWFVPA